MKLKHLVRLLIAAVLLLPNQISRAAPSALTDAPWPEQLVREGTKKLQSVVEFNRRQRAAGETGALQFVVEIGAGEAVPADGPYIVDEPLPGKPSFLADVQLKNQLNDQLRQLSGKYRIDAYLLLINYFDIKVSAKIPAGQTIYELFRSSKFFNENSNVDRLKITHGSITERIEGQVFGPTGQGIILSMGNYCGTLGSNENALSQCFKFIKINSSPGTNSPPPRTQRYQDIYDLLVGYLQNERPPTNAITTNKDHAQKYVAGLTHAVKTSLDKAKILRTYTSKGLDTLLNNFTSLGDYAALTVTERLHVLSVFVKEKMTGGLVGLNITDDEEGKAVKVIANTPPQQAEALLDGLAGASVFSALEYNNTPHSESDKTALIVRIIGRTGDGLLGDNYSALMKGVCTLLKNSPAKEPRLDQLIATNAFFDHVYTWDDSYAVNLIKRAPIGTNSYKVDLKDNGQVSIVREVVTHYKVSYNNKAATPVYDPQWEAESPVSFSPFDVIVLVDHSKLGLINNTADGGSVGIAIVPAVFLKYATDKKFNSNALKVVAIAQVPLDVATVVTGPGAIYKAFRAAQWVRAAWVVAEVANAGHSVVVTIHDFPDNRFTKVVEAYSNVMTLFDLAKLGQGTLRYSAKLILPVLQKSADGATRVLSRQLALVYMRELADLRKGGQNLTELAEQNVHVARLLSLEDLIKRDWKLKYGQDIEDVIRGTDVSSTFLSTLAQPLKAVHNRLTNAGIKFVQGATSLKYVTKSGDEFAKIENGVFTVTKAKPNIPEPKNYLSDAYVAAHKVLFEREGAGFIVIKSWIEGGNPVYKSLPERKFVGLRSEMDAVIEKYKVQGNDWTVLRDELNLGTTVDLTKEEIYYVIVSGSDSRFSFDIPTGNEGGAIVGEWVPAGYTKSGTSEAALMNSQNVIHNKDINQLLNYFGVANWSKIK